MGILAVISGTGAAGICQSMRQRGRIRTLKLLEWHLMALEQNMLQLRLPLPQALLAQTGSDRLAVLFREWGRNLRDSRTLSPAEAWQRAFENRQEETCLAEEDKRLMEKLAERLGQGNEAEEGRLFRYILTQLKARQEEAEQKRAAEERLWQYGGFMAGILVVLICL